MRTIAMATAISLSLLGLAAADEARASVRQPTNIPAEPLSEALKALANQRGIQVLYVAGVVKDTRTAGAVGDFTTSEALTTLLSGTGFTYKYLDDHTVTITSAASTTSAWTPEGSDETSPVEQGKASRSFPDRFHLAQSDVGSSAQVIPVDKKAPAAAEAGATLQEVVVTAQKRTENLLEVPLPVSAISAAALTSANQLRLQDYYTSVPGLNVSPAVQSTQIISIRGITTGYGTNPTVGITVDDVPYGSSTALGGGQVVPDIDPGDLARIEVLRGPQGTLYGASSLGGLIKFVTVDPSSDALTGRLQAGSSSVHNGAGRPGYNFRGSANIPISDTFAIRASAFTREDPGYIDNPVLGIHGINEAHAAGGHLAALWKPDADISLKLSALYQRIHSNGSDDVDVEPGLGQLQQDYLPGVGGYERTVQAYSAVVTANLAGISLTAVSGYNVNSYSDSFDYTSTLGDCCTLPAFGVTGTVNVDQNRTNKFSQEIRLSAPLGERFEWLLGGFYTHENSHYTQITEAEDPATGQIVPASPDFFRFPTTYAEYAGFADLTTHITEQFDLQIGARESHITQSIVETEVGPYVPIFFGLPSPYVLPEVTSSANAFTYLVTPRLKLSPDLMLYARLASGYRPGGPNVVPGVPTESRPDKTQNYEIGLKADFFARTLTVDASVYYIDWKDIQVNLSNPLGVTYNANGGKAKSDGIELSVEARPLTGLTVAAWVDWDNAVLKEDFPASSTAIARSGDRLPDSARFSGNLSLQQEFPLGQKLTGFVGGAVSYVGHRYGTFPSTFAATPDRQFYPSYTKTDLRAGVKWDTWSLNLFANNVTDRRAILSGGIGDYPPFAFKIIQPRLIGLSLTKTF